MKNWLFAVLAVVLLWLQFDLWLRRDDGYWRMRQRHLEAQEQLARNDIWRECNRALQADIDDLQIGHEALTELARTDWGYIKDGEKYYHFSAEPPDVLPAGARALTDTDHGRQDCLGRLRHTPQVTKR